MSRYEQEFEELCSLAGSTQITKRKKCIERLKELYENQEATKELDTNSKSESETIGPTWTKIMYSVHNILLCEAKRAASMKNQRSASTSRSSVKENDYSDTMLETIKKANSSEVLVNSKDVVPLVIQIFSDQAYIDYQKTYLTILVTYILPMRQYQTSISYDHWKELFKLSIELYEKAHLAHINKISILEAVYELIKHGCKQSHLALHLKKILPFLVKVFQVIESRHSLNAFEIANVACEQIGPEGRTAVCKFGEQVMRRAITLNATSVKYDWMLLMVRAHHPGGVTRNNKAAYAYDWEEWTNALRLIYLMILENCKSDISSKSFVQLACEVWWQLKEDDTFIGDSNLIDESNYSHFSKRRKIVSPIQDMVDVLIKTSLKKHEHSIQILIALATKYAETIKKSKSHTIIQFLIDCLESSSDGATDMLKRLWELGRVMFELDIKYSSSSADYEIKMWENIWNIALRSDSIKRNDDEVHKFLQTFIKHRKVIDSDAILNLYLKNMIAWSKPSIETLLVLCKYNAIPEYIKRSTNGNKWQISNDYKPVKYCLLQWVLTIPKEEWNAQFPVEATSELLLGLIIKSRQDINQITVSDVPRPLNPTMRSYIESEADESSGSKHLRCDLTSTEHIHLITAFEYDLYDEAATESIPQSNNAKVDEVSYLEENRDLLIENFFGENGIIFESELPTAALVVKTAVVAKIISNIERINMVRENVKENLSAFVKNFTEEISLSIEEIVNSKKKPKLNKIANELEALCLLYKTRYRNDVADIIHSSTEFKMLENILRLTDVESIHKKTDESEIDGGNTNVMYAKDFDVFVKNRKLSMENDEAPENNTLSIEAKIKMKCYSLLVTFCGMVNDEGNIVVVRENIQRSLLNPERYVLRKICNFEMAKTVLESFVDSELVRSSHDVTNDLLELLKELFSIWHNDAEVVRDILNILSKLFNRMRHDASDTWKQNSISMLNDFHKLLQANKIGPMVYTIFIDCLETIIRIDQSLFWKKMDDGDECETRFIQNLLDYIQSPFYLVRLRAIRCLQTIFVSNNVNLELPRKVFLSLTSMINKLFIGREELDENQMEEDDRRNRITTALHMMAVIIYSSAIFRSEGLLFIFELSVGQRIPINDVKRVLERISASLKIGESNLLVENYLNCLVTQWLEKSDSLNEFPISLTGSLSEQKFYQKYSAIIVPIVIQKKGLEVAKGLCNKYGIQYGNAIKDCFPRLISWLLPHISSNPEKPPFGISSVDITRAINVFEKLNQKQHLEGLQEIPVLVESNLQSVILNIIKRLHDEQYSKQLFDISVNYSRSDPPHFRHEDINRSFKYLEDNIIKSGHSMLHFLATVKQDVLQKVLLNLKCEIYKVNSDEYKLKAFHHYAYFSTMIVEELKNDYFDEMAGFVIRDICHTSVHFINETSNSVSQAACSFLFHFLERILPRRHKEIQHDIRFIINSITPIVKDGRTRHARDIMELLVVKHNDVLEDSIRKLAFFPMDAVFDKVREVQSNSRFKTERSESLENEIDHFLKTRDENTDNCSVTELQHLLNELSKKKEELKNMYQRLESVQRFSEECAFSLLHQLICALVKLTASSDPNISLTAAKCLGELGPADLSTMILQPEKCRTKKFSDPMLIFTYRVLILLSNFLTHSDIELFTATSKALYPIMCSSWGRKIYAEGQPEELEDEISQELLRIEWIRPFVAKSTPTSNTLTIDETKLNDCTNENSEIWTGELNTSHRNWIINITCKILDCFSNSYLSHLIPVCRANEYFCGRILPWIIHLIVHTEEKFESRIYDNINRFFRFHFNNDHINKLEENSSAENDNHKMRCFKSKSVRYMLNVVDFIRSQTSNKYLFQTLNKFHYLDIAKAAQYCSAYFTSVFYAELWCESSLENCSRTEGLTPIDYIFKIEPESLKVLQEILKEAYIKIGDPDAIYSSGTFYFQNLSAKIEHYAQFNRWDRVLLTHDIELSLGDKTAAKGLLDALKHSGLQYLLNASAGVINNEEHNIVDINHQYECAWRLSDWNIPWSQVTTNAEHYSRVRFQNPVTNDYSLYRYQTLKSFHDHDTDGFKTALKSARINAIKTLRNVSLESCKTVYPVLSQLQMLREIEEIYFAPPNEHHSIIEKWKIQDSIGVNDFQFIEPILTQRTVFLPIITNRENDNNNYVQNSLTDTYLHLTESSQEHGYFQIAARALGNLSKQGRLSIETLGILQYHEAILALIDGNHELSRRLLRNLIVKDSLNGDIRAQVLATYGNLMAETKSENPQKVIENYYKASLKCSEEIENPTEKSRKNMLDTRATLAQFADVQYQRLKNHMKSPQFKILRSCTTYTKETVEKLLSLSKTDTERANKQTVQTRTDGAVAKRARKLTVQNSIDETAEKNIKKETDIYLLLAAEHYILTLRQGDDYDLLVFKLVSLWLSNKQHKKLRELLEKNLEYLLSHKFILSVPQLAPHLSESDDAFSIQIRGLLKRCALDHPHHTLPVLLLLMNAYEDDKLGGSSKNLPRTLEPRVLAAKKLVEDLKITDVGPIVAEMEQLADSLIMLANVETEKNVSKRFPIPKDQSILRIKNLERIMVPTLSIDVKPNKVYDKIIGVKGYADVYDLVGGANAPKKITCVDTKGKKRYQLVKGRDDLRQDAVMQQVFTVMNILLRSSKEANKRKLRVRTYKVVPLSRCSGLLEWCDNTVPIGAILEGSDGLHAKYYPEDYTTSTCENELEKVCKLSNQERLDVFMDCCDHLHPVFHYFFLESFPSPEIWFEKRLSYMHSIATTSIIGYILGLGDRHLFNILIDKSTAEVVHIDFGITFDQGKALPFPDMIPFRLSRDIEAAMGSSGVEGVLRRSCEETLTVLRHQKGVIMTLLEVLLYDPISFWEITPDKVMDLQKCKVERLAKGQTASEKTNKLAERALLKLEQKLRGIEEGSTYSVAGQVEKLIQEARDPQNLSRMYYKQKTYL